MSTIEQSIQLYSILTYVCIGVAVIGLGLAIFFFIKYNIPVVFALETGRAKQKTIEKMMATGDFGLKEGSGKAGGSAGFDTGDLNQETQSISQTAFKDRSNPGQGRFQATTILQAQETVVLNGMGDPETRVLGFEGAEAGQTVPLNNRQVPGYAAHATGAHNVDSVQIGRFELIENTIVVNSNEII